MSNEQINKKRSKGFWLAMLILLILAPASLVFSWYIGDRKYYIASVLIMIYSMIPFFASFESRKPQARELATLAVMCALAVASRVAFIWMPNFKPMGGIIMIAAMAFGPQAGFMTGSLSMVVSNMIFGQSPNTPWQMFAYGMIGFVAGYLTKIGILSEKRPLVNAIVGFIMMVIVAGPILDTATIFIMGQNLNWEFALMVYTWGIPVNVSQGIAVGLCLLFLTKPLMEKLIRIKIKYGIMDM